MKRFFLTIACCCAGVLTFGQNNTWATVGATWRYDFYTIGGFNGPMIQTITKDTLINGTAARELVQAFYNPQSFNTPISSDTFYIAQDSTQYLLYRNGTFYPYYSRQWSAGDTVVIPGVDYACPDTTGAQAVLDKGTHAAMGASWSFTEFDQPFSNADWTLASRYYYSLFGGALGFLPSRSCIIDGGYYQMVCYKDKDHPGIFLDQYGQIIDTVGICDPFALPLGSAHPPDGQLTYQIFWQHNQLSIIGRNSLPVILSVMDMSGRTLWQTKTEIPGQIQMPAVPAGVYVVSIADNEGRPLGAYSIACNP